MHVMQGWKCAEVGMPIGPRAEYGQLYTLADIGQVGFLIGFGRIALANLTQHR